MLSYGRQKSFILYVIIMIAVVIFTFFYPLRSYLAMGIYSSRNYSESVMAQQNFSLHIPGGGSTIKKDWYPFVNVFDASRRFSRYSGQDVSLTVLYNFGAFKGKSSSIYDSSSEYFSAFYGAYVAKRTNDAQFPYGFNTEGTLNIDEITTIAKFDYKNLVIGDLGCKNPVFDLLEYDIIENIYYIGYEGWTRIDAVFETNSISHQYQSDKMSYIQYGLPMDNGKPDFYEITLHGTMYARYFDEINATIVLYAMGESETMIDECYRSILGKSKIAIN